jgi:sugar lactone lactonase YvrE
MSSFPRKILAKRDLSLLLVLLSLASVLVAPIVLATNKLGISPRPDHLSVLTPQGQTDFIRQIPLAANDVVYSPATKMLYASVPSSAGPGGNSITTIDPTTGSVTNSVFVGSEPNKLALSDNGTTLYTYLNGAYAIRRFDASTQTAGLQFPVGQDSSGLYSAADLAVIPGNPDSVAVARFNQSFFSTTGVAVFDNGVRRTNTANPGSSFLTFSATASKLYGTGSFNGLTTMNVDAAGVTTASTTSFSSGWRIKFDNGIVYGGNGQVINPDTGTLLGTFSSTNSQAFVPDSSVGRAYYLVPDQFGGSTRTLKAFDINTFLLVGSLTINGVVGDTSNLVRWGANGLAFRTSGNQLFLIQTSLIPSAEPIPTPTPTPSPTPSPSPSPIATFVRQVTLSTNDLIYNATTQSLYASVPSSAGTIGNSITLLDPVAAAVGNSVFIGSEPNKLALSDDLQTLYVALAGAGAVRRFDINSQTAGFQFTLGNDSFNGPRFASDIAVMPGAPGSIAVSRTSGFSSAAATAIYDDGVQRTQTYSNNGSLQFKDSSTLYLGNGPIQKLAVGASGLSFVSSTQTGSNGNIFYDNGLVYLSGGGVVDPESGLVKGTFSGLGFGNLMAVDPSRGRVFFLTNPSFNWTLRAYDINTFLPLGSVTILGVNGTPTSLVRWGTNGLAFRTTNGQIFLIQTALVDPSSSVPSPTPTPSPSPSPSPPYIPTFVQKLDLQANDLVISQSTQNIYASLASSQGSDGNSITRIDPATATIGPSVFIGSEPNKLGISNDGNTLHASLDGAAAIRRFDIPTMTAGPQFPWGTSTQHPTDIAVLPDSPLSIATSDGFGGVGVAIYDDGVRRTNTSKGLASSMGPIAFGADPATIYGFDSLSSGSLVKFSVDGNGVTALTTTRNFLTGSNVLKFSNGLLYATGGRVVDPEAQKLIGTFQSGFSNGLAVDQSLGRVFFVSNANSNLVLSAYDINTFLPLGSVTLAQGSFNSPTSLVRWGPNGLAFRVSSFNFNTFTNTSAVYLVQSALVSNGPPVPTGLQFSSATYNTFESFNNTLTVTVNRSGDVSSTTTVDYATTNGTATAGSDYTATSGTLTFTPGQLSKTLTVPILDDNIYEGANETFNITLSNPSGGAKLVAPATTTVTISDNESKPFLFVGGLSLTEGNSGTKVFSFPVTLSNASVETVTVDYTTADNTAIAGSDYVATSGTLTFPPGSVSNTINVTVNGDTTIEPDETFFVRLSNATNVSFLLVTQATGNIVNDDTLLQFNSPTYSVAENAGNAIITITRTGSAGTATVLFSTSNGTASSADYGPVSQTVTFNSGEITKTVSVPIMNDTTNEPNETVNLALSNVTGAAQLGSPSTAVLTINDNDPQPGISIGDASITEGDSGSKILNFNVTLSAASGFPVTVNYATVDGTAMAGSDYVSTANTLTFAPGDVTRTIGVTINGDQSFEPNELFFVNLANSSNATISDNQGIGTIFNDDAQGGIISFSQSNYSVGESDRQLIVTVNRTGDTSAPATVDYATSDGTASLVPCSTANGLASSRCDFTTALGTLRFAAGETSKTFTVLISQDTYVEGPETLTLNLTNLTGGAVFGANASATLTITDDASEPATNPADDARAFVIQHYHDFLNREPDAAGLDFWTNQITSCGNDSQCIEVRRINVSVSFFLSIEFQETGYLVERLYKTAYGDVMKSSIFPTAHQLPVPVIRVNEFLSDTQQIGQGVIVGQGNWQQVLETNKQAFIADFVQRSRFTTAFPANMPAAQFVDALNANAGNPLTPSERDQLVNDLSTNAKTRAQVLRSVAEHPTLASAEFNRAFVLMQYFGYLRRSPNDPQDSDYTGYDFWLTKLNQFNGNYINAEMVKAFISSIEYRQRFGP